MNVKRKVDRTTIGKINLLIGNNNRGVKYFADRIGIDRKRAHYILNGESPIYSSDIRRICQEFHVSPCWLLGLKEEYYED